MPSIQSLTMTYDALNEASTFSEGDALTGTVTLALLKDTSVECLFVKAKGDADVRWTTKSGDRTNTHHAHRRYFKLKQLLIPQDCKDTVLPQGNHVFKFSFKLPAESMPSSFRGCHGKIVYTLEAKLSRSWRMDSIAKKEINFLSKSFPNLHSLMLQQVGSTRKEMGLFSNGHVHMDVTVDKRAYTTGQTMLVVAKVNNSSSREMTPKFSLIRDIVYRANHSTKHESSVILKAAGDCIPAQTQKVVNCAIRVPSDEMYTILNCEIISVEYHLKVFLDISFAFDPKVKFPVVILPPGVASGCQNSAAVGPYPSGSFAGPSNSDFAPPPVSMGPYAAGAVGGPSSSNVPSPAVSMHPYRVSPQSGRSSYPEVQRYSAPPPAYPNNPPVYAGSAGVHPPQPVPLWGGYNNPVPQHASAYGSPFSSSSSSSVLHPPPAAPQLHPPPSAPAIQTSPSTQFRTAPTYNLLPSAPDFLSQSDEEPPAYSLLFPSTEKSDAK